MCLDTRGLGSARFARHYSGYRCFFLFLQVLRCFSSLRLPRLSPVSGLPPDGLPHSDTPGSKPVCSSPGFFAAYRVLLRLQKPRHPPSALLSFCLLFESTYLSVFAFREIVFADLFFFLTSLSVPNIVKQLRPIFFPRSGPHIRVSLKKRSGRLSSFADRLSIPSPIIDSHQKGGVPATPSGTATLLRLSPSHRSCPRPLLTVADFRHSRLPWLDGRCVQGPGTYSPRHG